MEAIRDFLNSYIDSKGIKQRYNDDHFWGNNGAAERCAIRGGDCGNGVRNGVFSLIFYHPRSHSNAGIGGRPAFCE